MYYILEVSRYTNIVYIGMYLVLTEMERLFSTVCYFFSHFCWSVNYISRVSKFHNFFLDIFRNWGKVYIWGILVLPCMESLFPTFQYFFLAFFHLVCKLLNSIVNCSFLLVSKLYELKLWFQICPEAETWIYIWEFLVLLFIKSSICTICAYSDFFLVCKLYNSGL